MSLPKPLKLKLAVTCLSGAAMLTMGQASASPAVIEQALRDTASLAMAAPVQKQPTGEGVKVGIVEVGTLNFDAWAAFKKKEHPAFKVAKIDFVSKESGGSNDSHANFVTSLILGVTKDNENGDSKAELVLGSLSYDSQLDWADYLDSLTGLSDDQKDSLTDWWDGNKLSEIPKEWLPFLEKFEKENSDHNAEVLNRLLAKDVFVANNSWGHTGVNKDALWRNLLGSTVDWRQFSELRKGEIAAYQAFAEQDRLMVFSTGNDGEDQPSVASALPQYLPELESNWLAVTAVDSEGKLAIYANACGDSKNWCVAAPGTAFGVTGWRKHDPQRDPQLKDIPEADRIKAPLIREVYIAGEERSGTSFAAPAVTRTVAKVKEKFGYMGGGQVQNVILTTATQQGDERINDQTGWGILNEDKALKGPAMLRAKHNASNEHEARIASYNIGNGVVSEWSNHISGQGDLIKAGSGTLRLTGNNSYTGITQVHEGTLAVDGQLQSSPLYVGEKGTLQGVGSLGQTARVGGTLKPGASGMGRLSFEQGLILGDKSRTEVSLGRVQSGVDVKGNPFVLRGKLVVNSSGPAKNGEKTAVVTSQNGIQGGFSELIVNTDLAEGQRADLRIGSDSLEVQINSKTLPGSEGLKGNQKQGALALNALRDTTLALQAGAYNDWLQDALDGKAASNSLSAAVTGQVHADAAHAALNQPNALGAVLSNRLSTGARGERANGVWLSQLSSRHQEGGGAGIDNSNRRLNGTVLGFDFGLNESLRVGAALSQWKSQVSVSRQSSSAEVEGQQIALYGRYGLGGSLLNEGFYLGGNLSYADLDFSSKRGLGNLGHYRGKSGGNVASAELNLGWQGDVGDVQVNPQVALRHNMLKRDAHKESGAGDFALQVEGDRQTQNVLAASINAGKQFRIDDWRVTPSLSLGYDHRLNDAAQSETSLAGTTMTPSAAGDKRGNFSLGAGVAASRDDWTLGLNLSGHQHGGYTGGLSLSVAW